MEVGVDVMQTFQKLTDAGALQKWGKAVQDIPGRRNVMMGARGEPRGRQGSKPGRQRSPQGSCWPSHAHPCPPLPAAAAPRQASFARLA